MFAAVGGKYLYNFSDNLHLRLEGYYYQPIIEYKDNNKEVAYYKSLVHRYFMASSSLVYQTLLGPVSLSLNYYDKDDQKFFFLFNFGYTLFNRSSVE